MPGARALSIRWGAATLGGVLLMACASPRGLPDGLGETDASAINALRWASPDADPVMVLTQEPVACLTPSADPDLRARARLGEIAFGASALLGGQAARAGLSCEACHRNGRDHDDFAFAGLTDAPGRVDVTHAFFGAGRADGRDNPVAILDLGHDKGGANGLEADALMPFLQARIVAEFDADTPPPRVLEGLAQYLVALGTPDCADTTQPVRWQDDADTARDAVALALDALSRHGDAQAADFLRRAAREALGRLHERFPQASVRTALREASAALSGPIAPDRFNDWLAAEPALRAQLAAAAPASWYDPVALRTALSASD